MHVEFSEDIFRGVVLLLEHWRNVGSVWQFSGAIWNFKSSSIDNKSVNQTKLRSFSPFFKPRRKFFVHRRIDFFFKIVQEK
jgi:hypothetical protein